MFHFWKKLLEFIIYIYIYLNLNVVILIPKNVIGIHCLIIWIWKLLIKSKNGHFNFESENWHFNSEIFNLNSKTYCI